MDFAAFLNGIEHKPRLAAVRLLVDGIITQIERGAVSPEEAFHLYFHVDNIIYVQKSLRRRAGRVDRTRLATSGHYFSSSAIYRKKSVEG